MYNRVMCEMNETNIIRCDMCKDRRANVLVRTSLGFLKYMCGGCQAIFGTMGKPGTLTYVVGNVSQVRNDDKH